MFRAFARSLPNGARDLMLLHPADLTALLELAWERRSNSLNSDLGRPDRRSDLPGLVDTIFGKSAFAATNVPQNVTAIAISISRLVRWEHLIYAYMIENTRIYDIFRRVIYEFLHGEKLGVPASAETQRWLRTTEELFYRDPPSFFITAITSRLRPDIEATRRNAYHRMFGMDLNHGAEDNRPYSFVKTEAANSEFASTFEEFLREVWIGMENVGNASGAKPTDDAKIADLAKKLHDMLMTRRQTGNLSREEFVAISMMSWFHLTVESNLPIIEDLRAQAPSAEQRLFKIAQRVGIPAHGLSENYFDIADSTSLILIEIELGNLNSPGAAPGLYTPGSNLEQALRTIIRHWSILTGRELKARKVAPS